MSKRLRVAMVLLAGVATLATGCAQSGGTASPAAGQERTSARPSAPSSSASGSPHAPGATPTPSPSPSKKPRKLRPGARGDDVRELQRRLKELKYEPGRADGRYGTSTLMAAWAFQKVNRLKRTSTLGTRFQQALAAPRTPKVLKEDGADDRVEIDLERQLLTVYEGGQLSLISHISSGSGELFCAKDKGAKKKRCRYAVTSTGDFRTGRRFAGWETSPLGKLYNPVYFNGGIAVHGAPSVPLYPASHGCVRIPMSTAEVFPDLVGNKEPVHVRRPD